MNDELLYNMHKQKDGSLIAIKDMTDSHLINTAKMLRRKAKEGIVIRRGGGSCAEDMWYDEDHLYGSDALREINFYTYKSECDRRGLVV